MFARLIRSDLAYFHSHPSGTLISRFMNDVWLLRSAASNVLAGIGKDALTVVFLVAVMFYQDWSMALVAFIALPLAIRPVVGIGRRMRRVSANTQVEQGQLTTLLNQTFQGARHVKAYGMEEYEKRRAASVFERIYRLIDRAIRTRARAGPMIEGLDGAAARLSAREKPRHPERIVAGGAGRGAACVRGDRPGTGDSRRAGRPSAA